MNGNCNWTNIIYEAEVCQNNQSRVGLASGFWKLRFNNHTESFCKIEKRIDTELSQYVWDLKSSNKDFKIFWRKLSQEHPYSKISNKCNLCTREKVEILKMKRSEPRRLLHARTGLFGKCLHRDKHLLAFIDVSSMSPFLTERRKILI